MILCSFDCSTSIWPEHSSIFLLTSALVLSTSALQHRMTSALLVMALLTATLQASNTAAPNRRITFLASPQPLSIFILIAFDNN
jgi:hypothetical protein